MVQLYYNKAYKIRQIKYYDLFINASQNRGINEYLKLKQAFAAPKGF